MNGMPTSSFADSRRMASQPSSAVPTSAARRLIVRAGRSALDVDGVRVRATESRWRVTYVGAAFFAVVVVLVAARLLWVGL
jgi:hypothetical protein